MPGHFHDFGSTLTTDEALPVVSASRTTAAVARSRAFKLVDCRSYECASKGPATVVVVDCLNDKVPSRNQYGIKNRERLALVFYHDDMIVPEVRALRKGFPTGMHQYPVNKGEAISICLYDEPWSSTRRHWTAETHLRKILWWLERAASGSLHQEDQPLEPLFYSSGMKLVLPPDFDVRVTQDDQPELLLFGNESCVMAVWKSDAASLSLPNRRRLRSMILLLPPIQHASIERLPYSLGDLHEVLLGRGVDVLALLKDRIRESVSSDGMQKTDECILLVMRIPLCRGSELSIERIQTVAFLIQSDICSLGVGLDVLSFDRDQSKYFKLVLIGGEQPLESTSWCEIEVGPVDIVIANSMESAQALSGIGCGSADFAGLLAGVGSLGSALAEIWASEGWGQWTYVDYDRVEAHNIVRHTAKYPDTGLHKVHVVTRSVTTNYYPGLAESHAIPDSAVSFENAAVCEAYSESALVVDTSTTLDVPREIALLDEAPRSMSAFFTPNGQHSVLLAEDEDRSIRLDALEAQYYRAILQNDWGGSHLDTHKGDIWVGNGCRDISGVVPTDLVQLHSALLARRIRQARDQDTARITVFCFSDEQGVAFHEIKPRATEVFTIHDWTLVVDSVTMDKLARMRIQALPSETGGAILGFIDQSANRIYVVDILSAPFNSECSRSSFVRGTDGLLDILEDARRRTAGIVSYLGEWHSHPLGYRAVPSGLDLALIDYLSRQLADEGQPALMLIAGENERSFTLKSDL